MVICRSGVWIPACAGMTVGSGKDGLAGKFQKRGHLRTFQDIQAWEYTGQPQGLPLRDNAALRVTVDILDASDGRLKGHGAGSGETVCCTGNMVGRCFTTWQGAGVSLSEL